MKTSQPFPRVLRVLTQLTFVLIAAYASSAHAQKPAVPNATRARLFDVTAFGARPQKAEQLDLASSSGTAAFQAALDAAAQAGGGTVYVPPGDYVTGSVRIGSHTTLHLDAGATWHVSTDASKFAAKNPALLVARRAENVSVRGKGRILGHASFVFAPGNGDRVADERARAEAAGVSLSHWHRNSAPIFAFLFLETRNITLEDIRIENAPFWAVRFWGCQNVFVRGVTVTSDLEKGVNADGIDIDSSRDVMISDSHIATADDAICIKTSNIDPVTLGEREGSDAGRARPVENVVVSNCVLTSSSAAFKIGTSTMADVRHVVFSNSVIRNANRGIGIQLFDGATVSDLRFSNITMDLVRRHWNWWGTADAIHFLVDRRNAKSALGRLENVVIDGITAHVRGTSLIRAPEGHRAKNIRISRTQLMVEPEGQPDRRISNAFTIEGVDGLHVSDLSVTWSNAASTEERAGWKNALSLGRVSDFVLQGTETIGANPQSAALLFQDVTSGRVLRNFAARDTGTFLELRAPVSDLWFEGNDLRHAKAAIKGDAAFRKALSGPDVPALLRRK